jgi:hypothetical protein
MTNTNIKIETNNSNVILFNNSTPITTPVTDIKTMINQESEYLGFSKAAVDFLKSLPDLSFMLTK